MLSTSSIYFIITIDVIIYISIFLKRKIKTNKVEKKINFKNIAVAYKQKKFK